MVVLALKPKRQHKKLRSHVPQPLTLRHRRKLKGLLFYGGGAKYLDVKCRRETGVNVHSSWFNSANGVRQGDNLIPTLFSIFIKILAIEVKVLNKREQMNIEKICLLLYAEYIVLLKGNEHDMQHVLDTLDSTTYE